MTRGGFLKALLCIPAAIVGLSVREPELEAESVSIASQWEEPTDSSDCEVTWSDVFWLGAFGEQVTFTA